MLILRIESPIKKSLLSYLPEIPAAASTASMEVDGSTTDAAPQPKAVPRSDPLPETEVYLRLLIINYLLGEAQTREKSAKLAHETVEKIRTWNRRTMDPLAARVWFALGRAYELAGHFESLRP